MIYPVSSYNSFEPLDCPLHNQKIPCLFCLIPAVATMVEEANKESGDGVLFQAANFDRN